MKDYHDGKEGNGVITNCSNKLEIFVDWDNENSDIFPLRTNDDDFLHDKLVYYLSATGEPWIILVRLGIYLKVML